MTQSTSVIFGLAALATLFGLILYVVFGQITVRKLRKNPETKERLGVEFASGLDILNVAQALSLPKSASRVIGRGKMSALFANSEVLYKHTTRFDRLLARIVYWLLVASVTTMLGAVILSRLTE